ncbi:MAG TPA: hypothetical protein VGH38_27790, partial [Bryobacteraceae bacterium]
MTDTELDEILDLWKAPVPHETWRRSSRSCLTSVRPAERRFHLRFPVRPLAALLGGSAGVLLCFFVVARAYPQLIGGAFMRQRIPYLAETTFTIYNDDGSSTPD